MPLQTYQGPVYDNQRRHYFFEHCGTELSGCGADGVRKVVSIASSDSLDPEVLVCAPARYFGGRDNNFAVTSGFITHP